jgi:hypothetical protein
MTYNRPFSAVKKLVFATFLLVLGASSTGFSQEASLSCGTGPAPKANLDYITELHKNGVFDQFDIEQVQNIIYVPLKIHIVGNNAGLGYYSLGNLMTNICELNQKYTNVGIQFFIRGEINYINNTSIYNLPSFEASYAANTQYNVNRVVNVYFANLGVLSLCGFANYPNQGQPNQPLRQGAIWLSPSCSAPGNSTFAHEMGHYLNLPHPFDETSDDPASPLSERVTRNPNEVAPRFSANCQSAGDRFCDTPADFRPNRWNCPGPNSTVADINGDLFQPDGTLYMSYANDACQNKFSPQQIAAMRATLTVTQTSTGQNVTGPRMFLLVPPIEPYDTITGSTNVLEPTNNSGGHPANWVYFKWRSVPGATQYVVRIRRNVSLMDEFIVYGDTAFLYTKNTLNPGVTYNVSVMPINHKVTCRPYSTASNFTVTTGYGVSVAENQADAFQVYPSLLQGYAPVKIQTSAAAGNLSYELTDVQGRMVRRGELTNDGSSLYELSLNELSNGAYLLRMEQGGQMHHQKIVIGR